jgi:hypothetical protein
MAGAELRNESTEPTNLAGLGNLRLVFEGGPAVTGTVEVAGRDLGPALAGWTDNFALHALQLGGAESGRILLFDATDNQPSWVGDEALYVDTLSLNDGAAIDCGEANLYYLNGGDPKQFFGGDSGLDGRVDVYDLASLANHYGVPGNWHWADADFTGDGQVNVYDLAILANNYGRTTAGGDPVPEPLSLVLLVLGGIVVVRRRVAA